MNLINRFIARTGNAPAAAVVMLLGTLPAIPALADAPIAAQYQGQSIRFSHLSSSTGALAIGVNDPGFAALLRSTGAVLTWKPGERYILITTSEPTVVSFALGDRRYDVGPIALQASIAPYERGEEVFLPFNEVLRSLDLALRQDGAAKVLQPQLATLDVRQVNDLVVLNVHGGATLHPRVVRQTGSEVVYAFDGVGTTLSGTRQINAGGVRSVQVQSSGSVRAPTALVTVELQTGATVRPAQSTADRDVVLSFGGNSAAPQAVAAESPTPEPVPPSENGQVGAPAANAAAVVTSVTAQASADGTTVAVAVTGNAQYEWHRLRDPDNRFWIDVKAAQLQGPPIEQPQQSPLVSMRVRQLDAATVRIALSLDGPKTISITPSATGLAIEIGNEEVADAARAGSGSLGNVISSSPQTTAAVTPAPLDTTSSQTDTSGTTPWKFGPRSSYVPTNPRLIVIDPGHGGSDRGTVHGGVSEADLTLDMAKRLRDILVARGWQVKLTHETDVDVYAPNDSPHDELQARVDVANNAGARLFVSIHVNAFINSGPYGTTYYISKPDDSPLASAMETHLESDGTKDDGIVKSHLYVTYHTKMPAVLVETAFLSNPNDYTLLTSAAWRQKVAQGLADAIAQYAQQYPASNTSQ
ncbi:MAG: N-acetylmuramoyl-L-alanine amidase [Candidatus Cybelea sp.]